jgi:hypothetical protein
MRSLVFVFLVLIVAACGSTSSSSNGDSNNGGDGGSTADAGSAFPADHPALPQVLNAGGPVLASPKFIAITFPNDTLATSIADFSTKIGASAYWTSVTSEYGVGPATSMAVQETTSPAASVSDDDIQSFLQSEFGKSLPVPVAGNVYALYYPEGTTVTLQGEKGCESFGGYHADIPLSATTFATYAVIPRCPPQFSGVTELDTLTGAASHEYIEAATDPFPYDNPAWSNVDANGGAWAISGGGAEIGDMCATLGNVFSKTTDVPYLVQRTWSNAAAAASHDPCVPQGLSPYFGAAPNLPDTESLNVATNAKQTVNLVHIPVGSTQTIELDLFSDADTQGTFTVSAIDFATALGQGNPELSFTFDKSSGQNGDKINMTIKALSKDPKDLAGFFIISTLGSNMTFWVGGVEN